MAAPASLTDARTGEAKRVPKLEGIRGVLALGVITFHVGFGAGATSFLDQPGNGFWGHLLDGMTVALPPFFVLSGLLLYRSFARAVITGTRIPQLGSFMWKRALRLLPAYWLIITVGLLTLNLNLKTMNSFWDWARPLLLVHFYWADDQPTNGLAHTWTVPTEFTFYLLMPLVAWLTWVAARRATDPKRRAAMMMVLPTLLVAFGIGWVVYTNLPSFKGPYELWFWPFYYVSAFAVGMMLAVLSAYGEASSTTPGLYRAVAKRPNLFWLAALVVYVIGGYKPFGIPGMGDYGALRQELFNHVLVVIFSVLLLLPLIVPQVESRLMDALLANKPMRFLGRISYGIYLWHAVVLEYWFKNGNLFGNVPVEPAQLRGTANFWELLVFTTVLSVAFAAISYYLLERPVIEWGKKYFRPKREASAGSGVGEVPASHNKAAAPAPYLPDH